MLSPPGVGLQVTTLMGDSAAGTERGLWTKVHALTLSSPLALILSILALSHYILNIFDPSVGGSLKYFPPKQDEVF